MIPRQALGALLAAAHAVSVSAQRSCDSNNLKVSYPTPVATDGWDYRLVAKELASPRGILSDSEGGLVVVDAGKGLLNHGIALSDDGNTLYASTHNDVHSWPYNASSPGPLESNTRRTIITNMTNSGHMTRTLLLSRSRPGTPFVSRGSASNKDLKAKDLALGYSQIRSFNISRFNDGDGPYDFLGGHVWGWVLRNSVGAADDPVHGGIWSVENSADQLHRDGRDIYTDNPGEELNSQLPRC